MKNIEDEILEAYCAGELPEEQQMAVEEQLRSCPESQAFVTAWKNAISSLSSQTDGNDAEDFVLGVMQAIENETPEPRKNSLLQRWQELIQEWALQGAAIAAAALLIVFSQPKAINPSDVVPQRLAQEIEEEGITLAGILGAYPEMENLR